MRFVFSNGRSMGLELPAEHEEAAAHLRASLAYPNVVILHRAVSGCVTPNAELKLLRWLLEASPALTGAEVPRTRRLAILTEALAAHQRGEAPHQAARGLDPRERGPPAGGDRPADPRHPVQGIAGTLVDRLVPRHESSEDLYVILSRLSLTEADADWVESLPAEALAPWAALLTLPPGLLGDATRLVAYRAAALGITRELLTLDDEHADGASPFLRLPPAVEALMALGSITACTFAMYWDGSANGFAGEVLDAVEVVKP